MYDLEEVKAAVSSAYWAGSAVGAVGMLIVIALLAGVMGVITIDFHP